MAAAEKEKGTVGAMHEDIEEVFYTEEELKSILGKFSI